MVLTTACAAVSITDTVLALKFATYASWVTWANEELTVPRYSPTTRPRWTAVFMTPTAAVCPFTDSGLPLRSCQAESVTGSRFKDCRGDRHQPGHERDIIYGISLYI